MPDLCSWCSRPLDPLLQLGPEKRTPKTVPYDAYIELRQSYEWLWGRTSTRDSVFDWIDVSVDLLDDRELGALVRARRDQFRPVLPGFNQFDIDRRKKK